MGMHHPTSRRLLAGVAALAAALAFTACGDDDDDDEDAGAASEDVSAFCAAVVAIDSTPEPMIDETAPPEQAQATLAEFAADMGPKLDAAAASAPQDVRADVAFLVSTTREALTSGDQSAMQGPEFAEADSRVDDWMGERCGYGSIETNAVDFEFEGIPDTVDAGPTGVTLENDGEELHEIILFRINDDVTLDLDGILALPEEEGISKVTMVGQAFAGVGETDTVFLDLEPGRYGAVCFIPVGTKSFEQVGDGPPHFVEGMKKAFTVE